ncbi:telomere regulation protein Stn1-domain-containing protein [Pyronema omphalodes]|nr:telomere regulation protein Stn1-domain-containing protein [Pyronema omphalodes]
MEDSLTFYPACYFDGSPTWNSWALLTASDVQTRLHRNPHGNDLFWYFMNHPIRYVRIVGIIVAFDDYTERISITLDDGSGETIDAMVWTKPKEAQKESFKIPDLSGIKVRNIVNVKGELSEFRGRKQLMLKSVDLVPDTAEEVRCWRNMVRWKRETLLKPWVLGEEKIKEIEEKQRRKRREERREERRKWKEDEKEKGKEYRGRRRPADWKSLQKAESTVEEMKPRGKRKREELGVAVGDNSEDMTRVTIGDSTMAQMNGEEEGQTGYRGKRRPPDYKPPPRQMETPRRVLELSIRESQTTSQGKGEWGDLSNISFGSSIYEETPAPKSQRNLVEHSIKRQKKDEVSPQLGFQDEANLSIYSQNPKVSANTRVQEDFDMTQLQPGKQPEISSTANKKRTQDESFDETFDPDETVEQPQSQTRSSKRSQRRKRLKMALKNSNPSTQDDTISTPSMISDESAKVIPEYIYPPIPAGEESNSYRRRMRIIPAGQSPAPQPPPPPPMPPTAPTPDQETSHTIPNSTIRGLRRTNPSLSQPSPLSSSASNTTTILSQPSSTAPQKTVQHDAYTMRFSRPIAPTPEIISLPSTISTYYTNSNSSHQFTPTLPDDTNISSIANSSYRGRRRPAKKQLLIHLRQSGATSISLSSLPEGVDASAIRELAADGYLVQGAGKKNEGEWIFVCQETLKGTVELVRGREKVTVSAVWKEAKRKWQGVGKEVVAEILKGMEGEGEL